MDNNKETKIKDMEKEFDRAKRKKSSYDCLIPLSGGKDSIYALYLCDKIYDMKVLGITFDNGFLSEHARNNISEAVRRTNADHIYYGVNPKEMMKLYNLFIKNIGAFCPPCMRGIEIVTKMGVQIYDIPLIVKGSGKRTSYLSYIPELFQDGNPTFFQNVIKDEDVHVEAMGEFKRTFNLKRFVHLSTNVLGIYDPTYPQFVSIFDYIDTPEDEMVDVIRNEMKWKRPEDRTEHMDCLASNIASYIHSRKVKGFSDKTAKNSSLIRLGSLDRSEAMKYESEYANNVTEPDNLDWFLKRINMNKEDFFRYIGDWKRVERYRPKDTGFNRLLNILRG